MLKVRNLYKKFEGVEVLKNINFDLKEKEVLVIIGPSGAGKSTLIRCINRLEEPTQGEIIFKGEKIDSKTDYNKLREQIGMVFQKFNLFLHLTALQNITLPLKIVKKKGEEEARKIALEYLAKVGLKDRASHYPIQLSGGEQQRVAIARALSLEPQIMLFDEPTSSIDIELIKDVLDVMKNLAKEGMTMIVVSHEMGFAKEVGDRIIFMDKGEIVEENDPNEFFINPKTERAKQFLSKIINV
ncbi:MAG: amino acid ABC transporter ATP-binding protein [Caldisericia bacterium]